MDTKELYKEIILDHGKNPRNMGVCKNYNHDAKGHNPLCGDKVHIYVKLDNNQTVEDLRFEGEGCAISLASASILTDVVKGKNSKVAIKIANEFFNMIKNNGNFSLNSLDESHLVSMQSLSGVKEFPMRVKCATMAWHTLTSALNGKN